MRAQEEKNIPFPALLTLALYHSSRLEGCTFHSHSSTDSVPEPIPNSLCFFELDWLPQLQLTLTKVLILTFLFLFFFVEAMA